MNSISRTVFRSATPDPGGGYAGATSGPASIGGTIGRATGAAGAASGEVVIGISGGRRGGPWILQRSSSSAMTANRSLSVISIQSRTSSTVRKQPEHICVPGNSMQVPMQGDFTVEIRRLRG